MKTYFSLSLILALAACAEPTIRSVDDETMEKADQKNAEAKLKNEQTALLGTWQGCKELPDSQSIQYQYTFASETEVSLRRNSFDNSNCTGSAAEFTSEELQLPYKILVNKDSTFHLEFDLEKGKSLKSEYKLGSKEKSQFPNVFELKDQKEIKLVELEDEEKFVFLDKVPPGEAEKLRLQAEKNVKTYVTTLLQRDGTWGSPCAEGKQAVLKFAVTDQKISFTHSLRTFKDDKCETAGATLSSLAAYTMTLDSVTDTQLQKIRTTLTKDKETSTLQGGIVATLSNLNLIVLSDFANNKKSVPYLFESPAGEAP